MPTNLSEMNLEDMILAYFRDKQGLIVDVVTGQVNVQNK